MKEKVVKVAGRKIKIGNLEKNLYPKDKITKDAVVDYYRKIARFILPQVKDRALSTQHFPNGINNDGFYQKQVPDYYPSWIRRKKIKLHSGGSEKVAVIETEADLVYLASQAVLTFHAWLSKISHLNRPDKIIYDLDPSPKNDLSEIKFAAKKLRSKLSTKGFNSYIMTTGSRGFHIVVPIKPDKDFDWVRNYSRKFAAELAQEYPENFTVETLKNNRRGRIFLDYLRNSYGQTAVCPYSLRALPGAPVAAPISWQELEKVKPQSFNISNIFERISAKGDPWGDFYSKAKKI